MNNSIKQIYASLELSENDIKLLVAEYYNTRFNVLKVVRKQTKGIYDFRIVNKDLLKQDIKSLIDECSNKIGAAIEKVILVLPAYNFKRFPLRSNIIPETGIVTKKDIARAITNALKADVDNDSMIVNPMITKYQINGLTTRRMPEKEVCDEVVVDIDLLCCDKDMTYDYVSIVEECGVSVLDITLNSYAIGKEAAIFEESLKQNVICLDIEKQCTYLSLFSKGKLVSTEIVFEGMNSIIKVVKDKFNIPEEDITKLLKFEVNYNSNNLNDVIYAYSKDNETITITTRDINDVARKPIDDLVEILVSMCKPIIEQGAILLVTGEAQQMSSLVNKIEVQSACSVRSYYPETIGVRDPSLVSLYGSLFVYKDKAQLNGLNVSCIDLLKYDSYINQKELDTEGETITTKIKNLFKQYVEKGEN